MSTEKKGIFGRIREDFQQYIAIRKAIMQAEREYFASEGESDPKRLEAQRQRDKEFLQSLKKVGIGTVIFLLIYALMKTVLGLW